MRIPPSLLIIGVPIVCLAACRAEPRKEAAKAPPREKAEEMELVGTLHKPRSNKMAHRLDIFPAGNLKTIELIGDLLKNIPENTPVRVTGAVKSRVVGPLKEDPEQYPIQWGVWLRVSKVETFGSLDEAVREPRDRFLHERDK